MTGFVPGKQHSNSDRCEANEGESICSDVRVNPTIGTDKDHVGS